MSELSGAEAVLLPDVQALDPPSFGLVANADFRAAGSLGDGINQPMVMLRQRGKTASAFS
ncbi:hypothetical protein F506_12670 [Herbaspirillum hiltneri N3]|uniref:Uncharacterized protein n=1 Tax=Herbaspirillum hiltneri N3 TaxID=1262470 RepID=A0ABM5V1N5_9BURK|nr:hypothetical protein F506_12670 [Herbaspirillum hiltneri N3]